MVDNGARSGPRWSLGALFLTALPIPGCVGAIDTSAGPADTGPKNERPIDDPSEEDDRLRELDPDLFAVAERYFPGATETPAPPRLARLTRLQLDVTTRALLPAHTVPAVEAAIPKDPLQINYEYAANLSFNPANFTPYAAWVEEIAASVRSNPTSVVPCGAATPAGACLTAGSDAFVSRAFRGVTDPAGLEKFRGFFTASVAEVGFATATGDLVTVTLNSPSYTFRDEVRTDADGFLLAPQQLQHLTYVLADAPAEVVGLSSASPGDHVSTADAFAGTVEQVLATREARDKLMRFFVAWLEVRGADEFVIEGEFPEFTPEVAAAVVDDTRRFLSRQLEKAKPVLSDITTSTDAFTSSPSAFLYGLTDASGDTPVELDPAERAGIFTQPAFIASHSPTSHSLVKRGVFFTRKAMCLPLGTPPEGAPTMTPVTDDATERQAVESVTAPAQCAGCHAYINPFGFMLENFDAIGRFRTEADGLPIDSSVDVKFLVEGPVKTTNGVDALKAFTASYQFQQCFVRQLFRFYMGRNEAEGDEPLLRRMFFEFAHGEQDIVQTLRVLANASHFSMRKEAP